MGDEAPRPTNAAPSVSWHVCGRVGARVHVCACAGVWFVHRCVCARAVIVRACGLRACVRVWVGMSVRACVRGCVGAWVRACVRGCVGACVRACVRACVLWRLDAKYQRIERKRELGNESSHAFSKLVRRPRLDSGGRRDFFCGAGAALEEGEHIVQRCVSEGKLQGIKSAS
jgi:hypothetical protein